MRLYYIEVKSFRTLTLNTYMAVNEIYSPFLRFSTKSRARSRNHITEFTAAEHLFELDVFDWAARLWFSLVDQDRPDGYTHAKHSSMAGTKGKRTSRGWKERINCIDALLLDERADEFRSKMLLVIVALISVWWSRPTKWTEASMNSTLDAGVSASKILLFFSIHRSSIDSIEKRITVITFERVNT